MRVLAYLGLVMLVVLMAVGLGLLAAWINHWLDRREKK